MTNSLPLAERPHALYRFYGPRRELLYVGITASLPTRLGDHNEKKPWWTDVVDIKVEHFPNRHAVLLAEREAIVTEQPRYNVVHNSSSANVPAGRAKPPTAGEPTWTFSSMRSGYTRTIPLWLYWEAHCDPVSDEYRISDIPATELWYEWRTRYPRDERAEQVYGPSAIRLTWHVEGPGVFEAAPFQKPLHPPSKYDADFLTHFTWPVAPGTHERMQWSALPVTEKVWRTDNLPANYADKGGFIQEATGWKPSPLQPYLNVHQLERMAAFVVTGSGS